MELFQARENIDSASFMAKGTAELYTNRKVTIQGLSNMDAMFADMEALGVDTSFRNLEWP